MGDTSGRIEEEAEEDQVKLPKVLDAMLQWTRTRREQSRGLYDDFLHFSQQASQMCQDSHIHIEAYYKLKDFQVMDESKKSYTNTLTLIFRFYCKLRQSVAHTFDQAAKSTEEMTFKELEIFCRDFRLVPRLLTKDDLRFLWENMTVRQLHISLCAYTTYRNI